MNNPEPSDTRLGSVKLPSKEKGMEEIKYSLATFANLSCDLAYFLCEHALLLPGY